jgi:hypothetical protein
MLDKEKHQAGGMGDGSTTPAADEARRMLSIFGSVDARAVDLTLTDSAGDKKQFRRNVPLADLARMIPAILDDAGRQQRNVIVRPHGPGVSFVQLDDLDGDQLARVAAVAFAQIETSPGNYQAWLAMPGRETKEFVRRVKKGTGADAGASGAVRIPGSLNFKPDYAPDYPHVQIREAQPGRKTSSTELQQLGLVAPPEVYALLPPALSASPHRWPRYDKALAGAPMNSEGTGPDRSKADFVWCMTCISWGFEIDETAAQLMQHSEKARTVEGYAKLTATKASEAVDRRRQQPRAMEHSRR